MKKLILGFFFLLFCFPMILSGQDLQTKLKELKDLRYSGDISESEYQSLRQKLLSNHVGGSSSSIMDRIRNQQSNRVAPPRAARTGPCQVNYTLGITVYWRAKDLVALSDKLVFKCDGVVVPGQVIQKTDRFMALTYPFVVEAGNHLIQIDYTPKVRNSQGTNYSQWETKTFNHSYQENICENGDIEKILEFIEKKGFLDAKPDIKFHNPDDYRNLLAQRKKSESASDEDKQVLQFLGVAASGLLQKK